jgi:hypothetical protein
MKKRPFAVAAVAALATSPVVVAQSKTDENKASGRNDFAGNVGLG